MEVLLFEPVATTNRWVQLGLVVGTNPWEPVWCELHDAAAAWLGDPDTSNFFFVRQPSGPVIRLETLASRARTCHTKLSQRLRPLLANIAAGGYEPDTAAFGGPAPSWAFSLLLVRRIFDGLAIAGGQERDVWARVTEQTGGVPPEVMSTERARATAAGIRRLWSDLGRGRATLALAAAKLAGPWGARLHAVAAAWRMEIFDAGSTEADVREALARSVTGHWNRGGLAADLQSLTASVLVQQDA